MSGALNLNSWDAKMNIDKAVSIGLSFKEHKPLSFPISDDTDLTLGEVAEAVRVMALHINASQQTHPGEAQHGSYNDDSDAKAMKSNRSIINGVPG